MNNQRKFSIGTAVIAVLVFLAIVSTTGKNGQLNLAPLREFLDSTSDWSFLLAGAGLVTGCVIYFLPAILARKSANFAAIFALDLFLGWTILGWVGALVWAIASDERVRVIKNTSDGQVQVSDTMYSMCPKCLNRINYGAQICQYCHTKFSKGLR